MHLELTALPQARPPGRLPVPLALQDAALLAWLVLEGATPRSRVAALLWPGSEPEAARNALRQRLFQLRRQLGAGVITGSATLSLAAGVTHDLAGTGPVLGELSPVADGDFAQWLDGQRRQRRDRRRQTLAEQATRAESAGDWPQALACAGELLTLDPLSEAAHQRLIRLHYLAGDRAAALLAFDRCEQVLKHEVGARPSADTLALLQVVESAAPVAAPQGAPRRAPPLALLRPPRLVGRHAELDELSRVLADAGRLALVGEAGMGKSRLLGEAVAAHAAAGGRPLVLVQARPGDAAVPYATLSRCLRALAVQAPEALAQAPAGELARLLPELGPAPARSQDADGLKLLGAVQQLLDAAAQRVGALLLDDLHFSDDASAQLLQVWLGAGADDAGMALVMAVRPQTSGAAGQLLQAFEGEGGAGRRTLAPLDEPALVQLLDALALPGLDAAALAPALLRHTGGNPMFVLETLKHAWDAGPLPGGPGVALAHPRSVGQLIERRLQRLSPDALAVARLAAMAGPDFGIELAEALLHTPALRLADAWNELEAAQVMRGDRFAHDLVFEAVLRSVPPPIARHSYRSLAVWLEQHGGEPERIADHWQAAGDAARSVPHLLRAGDRNIELAFFATAVRQLRRAAQAAQGSGLREAEFEALRLLHIAYTFDDPGDAHDAVIDRLDALADSPVQRLDAHLARHNLARRRISKIDVAQAQDDLRTAQGLGDDDRVVEAANLLLYALIAAGRPDAALAVYEQHAALLDASPDLAARSERHGNLSTVLSNLDRFDDADVQVMKAIELARQGRDWPELMVLMCNRQLILRHQGRHAALEWLAQIDRLHASDGSNQRSWLMSRMVASELLRDAGRYEEALQALGQDRARVAVVAGDRLGAWAVSDVGLWLQLGQHARALQVLRALEPSRLTVGPAWLQAKLQLVHAQARARALAQGLADRPDAEAWERLNAAAELAPREARRAAHFDVELQRAAWSEPDVGAALAEGVAAQAQLRGMLGYARRAWLLACARALDAGRPAAAQRAGAQALALATHVFDAAAGPEPVIPTGMAAGEVDLLALRLAALDEVPDLPARARQAVERLHATARVQVPEAFRDGFLQRVPAHVALQSLAQRLAGGR